MHCARLRLLFGLSRRLRAQLASVPLAACGVHVSKLRWLDLLAFAIRQLCSFVLADFDGPLFYCLTLFLRV